MAGGSVFISYRRGADSHAAARLAERLGARYGAERIFFDVQAIPPGEAFAQLLDARQSDCAAFVPVIGPGWVEAAPRLHHEDDFVRREIAAALARDGLPVLPLLIEGAAMPAPDILPPDLAPLPRLNAIAAPHDQFATIVDGPLAGAIDGHIRRTAARGNAPLLWIGAVVATLAVLAFLWALIASRGG